MQSRFIYLFCFFFLPITYSFAHPDTLILDQQVYQSGEIIHIQFDFEKPGGMLYTNRGGCGDGPEFVVVHEQNSDYNMAPVHCDHLILESYYLPEGHFEVVVYEPGTYYIRVFFTTEHLIETKNPKIREYTSGSFEVR